MVSAGSRRHTGSGRENVCVLGPDWESEGEIVSWEHGKKIAWRDPMVLVEWTLEVRGGKTILRLVQSGSLGNEDWENEWFESTNQLRLGIHAAQLAMGAHTASRRSAPSRLAACENRASPRRRLPQTAGARKCVHRKPGTSSSRRPGIFA